MGWGFLNFFLVLAFLFLPGGTDPAQAAEKSVELKIAYETPPASNLGKGIEYFKELVEKGSNGEIQVKIYHSGSLGRAVQLLEAMKAGAVEMSLCGFSPMTTFDQRLGVFDLPFLIRGWDHGERILYGPVAADLDEKWLKKTGIRSLGWTTSGIQGFYNSKKPILALADLKGLKMRTMESPVKVMAMNAYGSKAVVVGFTEFYAAMQQGVVDGGENSIETYQSAKHYEVAKYYTESNHVMLPAPILVAEKFFQRLSPKNQKVVASAGLTAVKKIYQMTRDDVANRKEMARKGGAELFQLNPGEREKFEKAVLPVYEKVAEKVPETREIIARIKDTK